MEIRDEFDTLVRSGSGTGYNMNFPWDGRDNNSSNLPDGEYQFSVNATETTPPPQAPPGGGGGGLPAPGGGNFAMAAGFGFGESYPTTLQQALFDGMDSYFITPPPLPPVKQNGKWVQWEEVFGPVAPIESDGSAEIHRDALVWR